MSNASGVDCGELRRIRAGQNVGGRFRHNQRALHDDAPRTDTLGWFGMADPLVTVSTISSGVSVVECFLNSINQLVSYCAISEAALTNLMLLYRDATLPGTSSLTMGA